MNVKFELKAPPPRTAIDDEGHQVEVAQEPAEYVRIKSGRDGNDEVVRLATEDDKARWPEAYAAFLNPPDPKAELLKKRAELDAQLAALDKPAATLTLVPAPESKPEPTGIGGAKPPEGTTLPVVGGESKPADTQPPKSE